MNARAASWYVVALGACGLGGVAVAGQTVPLKSLQNCAAIEASDERLRCYDGLAGRGMASAAKPTAGAVSAGAPTVPAAPAGAAAAGAAAPVVVSTATPQTKDTFGLYEVEHPKAPVPTDQQMEFTVAAVGGSAGGHTQINLEPHQLWDVFDPAPILRKGEKVIVKRATLGSFLLTTSSGRVYRARRLS